MISTEIAAIDSAKPVILVASAGGASVALHLATWDGGRGTRSR